MDLKMYFFIALSSMVDNLGDALPTVRIVCIKAIIYYIIIIFLDLSKKILFPISWEKGTKNINPTMGLTGGQL